MKNMILTLVIINLFGLNLAKAEIKSYKTDIDGITFSLDKGLMKIKVCKDDIVEVRYTIFNTFPEKILL